MHIRSDFIFLKSLSSFFFHPYAPVRSAGPSTFPLVLSLRLFYYRYLFVPLKWRKGGAAKNSQRYKYLYCVNFLFEIYVYIIRCVEIVCLSLRSHHGFILHGHLSRKRDTNVMGRKNKTRKGGTNAEPNKKQRENYQSNKKKGERKIIIMKKLRDPRPDPFSLILLPLLPLRPRKGKIKNNKTLSGWGCQIGGLIIIIVINNIYLYLIFDICRRGLEINKRLGMEMEREEKEK